MISHWQKIKNTNPKTKGDLLNQIIWNNRVNKSPVFVFVFVFSPGWNKVGIENLSCLFDDESNTLLTFTTFMQKYSVKSNFLQYYNLLCAIPLEWKTMLKQECFLPSTEYVTLSIEKLTCNTIYNTLLNCQHFPPPAAEKDSLKMALTFKKDKKYTDFLFVLQNEVKLCVFQCKIVHNILSTNKILHKMKKKQH